MHGNRRSGYTLLEMALVILILSIVAGTYLTFAIGKGDRDRRTETNRRMDVIEEAIKSYRKKNDRLPCPSNITAAVSAALFGVEGASAGTCVGGSPAASWGPQSSTVYGGVPTKTLGLPDEYAFDAWGGRFLYAIDKRYTGNNAFTTYNPANTTSDITVKDQGGNNKTTTGILVILSHGPNGHGAIQYGAGRKATGSLNNGELTNCHCTSAAADAALGTTFYQYSFTQDYASELNTFDDIVRYYLRSQLLSYAETQ